MKNNNFKKLVKVRLKNNNFKKLVKVRLKNNNFINLAKVNSLKSRMLLFNSSNFYRINKF